MEENESEYLMTSKILDKRQTQKEIHRFNEAEKKSSYNRQMCN